jgi:hypothetical protein
MIIFKDIDSILDLKSDCDNNRLFPTWFGRVTEVRREEAMSDEMRMLVD